ncbi:MAG: hypothetical protein Q8O84_01150 [Nanoarchaeota archaeon]|nr:hypothetical protein [Nanoarchaeota archaeon]
MVEYLDKNNKKIEKGFYKIEDVKELFYFTGNYDEKELPIFDSEDDATTFLPAYLTKRLNKVDKRKIEDIIKESKNKINWLEKLLEE